MQRHDAPCTFVCSALLYLLVSLCSVLSIASLMPFRIASIWHILVPLEPNMGATLNNITKEQQGRTELICMCSGTHSVISVCPLCPTHEQIQCGTRSALPMAGLFAHRWPGVGRMLGAPDLHRVAALTWLDKPFGPTHPDVGCMTARRCAKVLAGGFQVSWLACCEGRPKECTRPVLSCECLGLGPWFFWLQSFSEVLPCAWATWQHNRHDIL